MKTPSMWGVVLGGAALLGLGAVLYQQRGLAELREHRDRLTESAAGQAVSPGASATVPAGPGSVSSTASAGGLTDAERVELMRLRSRVTDLRERQRGRAAVSNEQVRLQARLASVNRQSKTSFPEGWVKRQEARMAGTATPQAAFETMIWAFEHRDTNVLFQIVPAEMRASMKHMLEGDQAEEFWRGVGKFPGFCVRSVKQIDDTTAELSVEMVPGAGGPTIKARLEEGNWRVGLR